MESAGKLRVLVDGQCPFCQWAQQNMRYYDREQRLEFCDFNQPAIAAETPFDFRQLDREMHVRTPDGSWHTGFLGWVAVLSALPRWRGLARLLRLPPLRWLGPPLYRFVADHRNRMPRVLLRWLGAPPPCSAQCEAPKT